MTGRDRHGDEARHWAEAWRLAAPSRATSVALAVEAGAGLAAALLAVAYCLSFSALLFQGELREGLAAGFWALLAGSAITGLTIAATSALTPAAAGPNNPAVAVLSVLAAGVGGAVLANGGSAASAADHVLISFTLATLLTGMALFGIGAARLGQYVRFVPYPVIGGFLAASGWLLTVGGIRVVMGEGATLPILAGALPDAWPKIAVAIGLAAAVHALNRVSGRANALPIMLVAASVVLNMVLESAGLRHPGSGWYLVGTAAPVPWMPLPKAFTGTVDWHIIAANTAEIAAAAAVTIVALLLDVSSLEVSRARAANLDLEFRSNGLANLLSAPVGGVMGKLSVNATRLMEESGGRTRTSGIVASLIAAAIAVLGLDLAKFVPAPILGGLLIYVGLSVLADVLLRSPARRAWSDYALAILIMLAIVNVGYLAGVMLGFVGACLMFAMSYSRIDVIRRHLTRAVHASNVDRATEAARLLAREGERIHIFWLAGYVFFGSAHRLFETIVSAMSRDRAGSRSFAVLDLAAVTGFDTSALLSLVKLRNHAGEHGIVLAFAGLDPRTAATFDRLGLVSSSLPHRVFASRDAALAWCEDEIIGETAASGIVEAADIAEWLAAETGGRERAETILKYLVRREVGPGERLYAQGEAAGSIDLVIDGAVAVTVESASGRDHLVRRMARRTVVGEMGFFRNLPRAATVTAAPAAVVYTLTREAYGRLLSEQPEAGAAFLELIVRALSDRLDFANAGIAALS